MVTPLPTEQGKQVLSEAQLQAKYDEIKKQSEQDPKNPKYHAQLGEVAELLGNADQAIDHYIDTFDNDNKNFIAAARIGELFMRKKKYDLALPYFGKALKIKPDFIPALFSYGLLQGKTKQFSHAKKLFFKILQLQPAHQSATHNLFKILFDQKQYDACVKLLDKALQILPQDQQLHDDYGLLSIKMNNPMKALEMFTHGINLNMKSKESVRLYDHLFNLLFAVKQYQKAKELIDQALKHFPDYSLFVSYSMMVEKTLEFINEQKKGET
ncbi:hypothetical protein HYY69_04640 [Candidatus Woesearchaeota archaeon]|nr:hypothetical protein [Candidatus Woesearchaeota archaeon]